MTSFCVYVVYIFIYIYHVCLSIHQLKFELFPIFWYYAWSCYELEYRFMCEVILSVYIPRNGISVVYDNCMFNLLMTCTPFIHLKEFQLQISSCLSSNFPTSLLTSVIFFLFFFLNLLLPSWWDWSGMMVWFHFTFP